MYVVLAIICIVGLSLIAIWIKRKRARIEMEQHSISPEALRAILESNQHVLLYDVRQPLDLLADSEILPGATRISPREVLENPALIPKDNDVVVYCTCPGDETSRRVLHRARKMHISRIRLLKGGLAAWKAKGYPVVPYNATFHLDIRS